MKKTFYIVALLVILVIAVVLSWKVYSHRNSVPGTEGINSIASSTSVVITPESKVDIATTSPSGTYRVSETLSKENVTEHITDTTTGTDLLQKFIPESDLPWILIGKIVWGPKDQWFVFHSTYQNSDYPMIDGIYVYQAATNKLSSIAAIPVDSPDSGYLGYANLTQIDPTHIQFIEVRYPERDHHYTDTATLIHSYEYDVSTGALTTT